MATENTSDSPNNLSGLAQQARETLNGNWAGEFTKPAPDLYPHQWSWDAAFIAIGRSHFNQSGAEQELRHLLKGQWDNGMIPHIVFGILDHDKEYFPKPGFWKTDRSPHAPDEPRTSGMCQPPVHATALRHIIEHADDRETAENFAAEIFEDLKAWHAFLYRERDPYDEGLVYLRHPWESGQDNSPIWDQPLERIDFDPWELPNYKRHDTDVTDPSERPDTDTYDRYVYLVDYSRQRNYDEKKIWKDGAPFAVQDVLFNTLLCRANQDLAEVASIIGKYPGLLRDWAETTQKAVNEKLWDEEHGMYIDYDLIAQKGIHQHALAGFLPLFAGIPDRSRAERIFNYLNTHCFCRLDAECFAAPSYDRSGEDYSSRRYWRGPVWINMNWLLGNGLEQYGYEKYCRHIRESIMRLPQNSGFREYYDPDSGEGYGAENFSWSAALMLDTYYHHFAK